MIRLSIYILIVFVSFSCENKKKKAEFIKQISVIKKDTTSQQKFTKLFKANKKYISDGFDFPVGKPDAKGYYNAQKFQENNHLGDDWNGVSGGNSDLGDAIYAVANGYLSEVQDYEGGWGKVVRIVHLHKNKFYESVYAHCDTILKPQEVFINKGDKIATIGNCNGLYLAHLHLEIRDSLMMDIGPGYSSIVDGYLNPTNFILNNRN